MTLKFAESSVKNSAVNSQKFIWILIGKHGVAHQRIFRGQILGILQKPDKEIVRTENSA